MSCWLRVLNANENAEWTLPSASGVTESCSSYDDAGCASVSATRITRARGSFPAHSMFWVGAEQVPRRNQRVDTPINAPAAAAPRLVQNVRPSTDVAVVSPTLVVFLVFSRYPPPPLQAYSVTRCVLSASHSTPRHPAFVPPPVQFQSGKRCCSLPSPLSLRQLASPNLLWSRSHRAP